MTAFKPARSVIWNRLPALPVRRTDPCTAKGCPAPHAIASKRSRHSPTKATSQAGARRQPHDEQGARARGQRRTSPRTRRRIPTI